MYFILGLVNMGLHGIVRMKKGYLALALLLVAVWMGTAILSHGYRPVVDLAFAISSSFCMYRFALRVVD